MKVLVQKLDNPKQPISYLFGLLICSIACILMACTTADSATSTTRSTLNSSISSPTTSTTKAHEKVPSNSYHLGEKAPDFALTDFTGTTRSLSGFKGKFVVIHFATTCCPFCHAEASHLEQIY